MCIYRAFFAVYAWFHLDWEKIQCTRAFKMGKERNCCMSRAFPRRRYNEWNRATLYSYIRIRRIILYCMSYKYTIGFSSLRSASCCRDRIAIQAHPKHSHKFRYIEKCEWELGAGSSYRTARGKLCWCSIALGGKMVQLNHVKTFTARAHRTPKPNCVNAVQFRFPFFFPNPSNNNGCQRATSAAYEYILR